MLVAAPARDVVDIQQRLADAACRMPTRSSVVAPAAADDSSGWRGIEDEYTLLETSLGDPELLADQARLRAASKRYKDLTPLVEALRRHRARRPTSRPPASCVERRDAATSASCGVTSWRRPRPRSPQLEDEIRTLMLPKDPNDGKAVIMEIRGAEGGEEANLFARDLFEMYQGYASR